MVEHDCVMFYRSNSLQSAACIVNSREKAADRHANVPLTNFHEQLFKEKV